MVPSMHGEVGRRAEPLRTLLALEQFLAGVLARVHAQLRARSAAFEADWAYEPAITQIEI